MNRGVCNVEKLKTDKTLKLDLVVKHGTGGASRVLPGEAGLWSRLEQEKLQVGILPMEKKKSYLKDFKLHFLWFTDFFMRYWNDLWHLLRSYILLQSVNEL